MTRFSFLSLFFLLDARMTFNHRIGFATIPTRPTSIVDVFEERNH